MKKKWIAFLLALSMIFSTLGVQATDGTLMGWNFAQGGVETVKGQGTFTDMTAKATESYEYEIAGDDGTVAVVDVPAILREFYAKYTVDFSAAQPVPEGTYILMGGRNDTVNNTTSAITRTDNVAFTNYTDLIYTTNVNIANDVITQKYADSEWDVTYNAADGTYIFKAPDAEKYLAIYNADDAQGAVSATTVQNLQIVRNTKDSNYVLGSAVIGGPSISNGTVGYLNTRDDNPGTWNSIDQGSAWVFYQKNYEILDDVITELTQNVKSESEYTPESWEPFGNALQKANGRFTTEEAGITAYNDLDTAVKGLVLTDVNDVAEKVYVKTTTDFNAEQPVPNNTYVIVGAHTGNGAAGKVITRGSAAGSFTCQSISNYFEASESIIRTDLSNAEWKFAYQGTSNNKKTYAISAKTATGTVYLDTSSGLTTTTTATALNVVATSNHYANSVGIGLDTNKYLNYNQATGNVGLWEADAGSTWYLYAAKYDIKDAKVQEAIAGVTAEADYAPEKWSAYQNALAATEGLFDTEREAVAAYDTLVAAVAALTAAPTTEPTEEPTTEPTAEPTAEPTTEPTAEPTAEPTTEPVPENIAPGKAVYVSGTSDGDKNNVNDRVADQSSKWDSQAIKSGMGANAQDTGDAWIYLDLGTEKMYEVSQIVVRFFNKIYPTSWLIETSNDAQNWTPVTEVMTKEDNGPVHPVETVDFETPFTARYVRLYFNTLNTAAGGNGVGITEFEVYGVEKEIPEPSVMPEGISKTTKGLYSLVQIGEGETVQPGTYLILSSRFHRALLPENNTANNKLYLQILSQPANITNEVPPSTIEVTEAQMAAYKLDWEISKDGDNYYIKNAGTNGYLRFTAGAGTVSATLGEDAKVATTINRYTGSEAHNGSVVIGQSGQYLNMHGGNTGNYGGYDQNYDGGSAHYLYEKQADVELYVVDTAALQNLVTEYTNLNLQSANYTADSWAAYNTALTSARTLLNQDHSFEAFGVAVADKASVDSALAALQSAKAALVKVKYTMKELYDAVCEANGGSFLYSEEVYTPASGIAYRDALKAARGTFATSEEALTAMENLKNAVKGLTLKEDMKSTFPEITWTITEDIRIDGTANYVENLPYINTSPLDVNGDGTADFDTYEALDWEWDDIAKLVNDEERKVELVWTKDDKGISYAQYGQGIGNDFETANVYKISGVFEWPEGYDINNTTVVLDSKNDFYYRDVYEYLDSENLDQYFPMGQVFPIDDDAYVVFWVETDENSKPTVDTINESLAFWAGTSGKGAWTQRGNTNNDWGRTETATFIEWNLQGERTFRDSYPNAIGTTEITDVSQANGQVQDWNYEYIKHSDGWYTLTDTSSINSVLRSNNDSIAAGTKVHIDLYVMNNSGTSAIDELEIELFTTEHNDVTVNYYLNEVSDTALLGSEQILNVEPGTEITILPGVRAGQLNSYKAEAIYQAGYKDVTDGVQQGDIPYVVDGTIDNVINIVYTVKDAHTIYLTAPSKEVPFSGAEQTLSEAVVVTEYGYDTPAQLITEGADAGKGAYLLPDGNIVYGVFAEASGTNPGEYDNDFVEDSSIGAIGVKNASGQNVTSSYAIMKTTGILTINEYEAPTVAATYDFAVTNNYALGEMLSDLEASAVDVTLEEGTNAALNSGILSYKPDAAGASETVELTLKFNDSYSVTKEVKFVPASTVLYGEQFMTKAESSVWTAEGTAADYTVGDNATTVYGYTGDIKEATYTENSVLKATLDVNGDSGITGLTAKTDAMTFTFTGTGFDLLSACGPDTGMIVAKVTNQNGEVVGSYLVDTYFTGDLGTNAIISSADAATYQVPVVRNLDLPYGNYTVTVHGYLLNTSGALRTFGMEDAAIPTEDLVMTMLEDLEMYDVDVDDVEISFMNEDSVLNGGSGNLYAESEMSGFALAREGEGDSAQAAGKDSVATVYVDGFRVYEPLTAEAEGNDYAAAEQQTKYRSVYEFIKTSVNDLGADSVVYIEYDGNTGTSSIADYKIQGPQNEVYLTGGNSVAFAMEGYNTGDVVQIGAKLVTPGAKLSSDNGATETQLYATEMYYPVTVQTVNGMNCVVIKNTGDANTVLSISTLKVSENIGIYASAEIGQQIIETPAQEGETNEEPAVKITTAETVLADRYFAVRIETSKDVTGVDLVIPGGVTIALTAENAQAVAEGAVDVYRYSHSLAATLEAIADGSYTFTVIAHYADGTNTEETVSVAVQTQAAVQ